MTSATESTPLLVPAASSAESWQQPRKESFQVLFEIIGARNLPVDNMETYCVVQYGARTIHRTKPYSSPKQTSRISRALGLFTTSRAADQFRDPIWTMHEDCILTVAIHQADIDNNKQLKITVWARPQTRLGSAEPMSVGTIRIKAPKIIQDCASERMELQLMTELDSPILDGRGEPAKLAYRCRIATKADLKFFESWMKVPRPNHWREADIVPEPGLSRARLLTDIPEYQIQSTTPGVGSTPPPPGHVRIKPYPDPTGRSKNREFIAADDLKKHVSMPSRQWIQAGSRASSIGRLYLEVLSAHELPNVDIGGKVGNVTDAFCSIVYGDAMAQTDVIFDELSPHWPPWSQRAFVFYMQHPSQVLYLALFGFKRTPLQHRPIGRIEVNPINLHSDTIYNLEYDLYESSHGIGRQSRGKLRIRVRIEIDDERKALFAALQPPPPVYINTTRKKSMAVARYTACGEYDNEARFSLQVLQGYIDEILEGYVRRTLYSIQDGAKSLVLWRDQVIIFGIGLPLFSFLAFVLGILVVEKPRLIPAMIAFTLALCLLEQMNQRLSSPSPWRRCLSFSYYLRVLIFGRSGNRKQTHITAFEGATEFEALQKAMQARIAKDKQFIERKEAFEKQIEEIESFKLQDNSQPIPMELLIVLGKVQSIVGDFCRLCRLLDAIITWEESDVAFWITLGLLVVGTLFIFIPWGWLLLWTGRIVVVMLLGPQNKVLDMVYYQTIPTDDQRIYQIFATRMFEARCRQENAGKLKAFRQLLFGKCATLIPPLYWSPHQDFPLGSSTTSPQSSGSQTHFSIERLPIIPGQTIYGYMIPRPKEQWEKNVKESEEGRAAVNAALQAKVTAPTKTGDGRMSQRYLSPTHLVQYQDDLVRPPSMVEEGLEITDLFDEEAGFIENVPSYWSAESNKGTVSNLDSPNQASVHDFGDETSPSWDENDDDDEDSVMLGATTGLVSIPSTERQDHQSMIEVGFELGKADGSRTEFPKTTLQESSRSEGDDGPMNAAIATSRKLAMSRNEAWGVSSATSSRHSERSGTPPHANTFGIQHAPTIVNAENDDTDAENEMGFEIIAQ